MASLEDVFSIVINSKISENGADSISNLKNRVSELIGRLRDNSSQSEVDKFVQNGSHIHVLTFLFSECHHALAAESRQYLFPLVLCPRFSVRHSIDCLMTIWTRFVAETLDDAKKGTDIAIANDVIQMMMELLSDSQCFTNLLHDIGSAVNSNSQNISGRHSDRLSIDAQCQQSVRCLVELYTVFAPYLYLIDEATDSDHTLSIEHCHFFKRRPFIQYLCSQSFSLLIAHDSFDEKRCLFILSGTAVLWSTLCRLGFADAVNEVMVDYLEQNMQYKADRVLITKCSAFIGMLSRCPCFEKWFESFLITFSRRKWHSVSRVDSIRLMAHLMQMVLDNECMESQMQYLLGHKLILRKTLPLHCLDYIVALMSYLTSNEELLSEEEDDAHSDCLMLDTLSSIGSVWKRDSFVQNASMHRHRYLTRALVLLMGVILERLKMIGKEESASNVIPFVLNGVQSRFSSERLEVRYLGMLVAEQYSKVIPGAEQLKFGNDLSAVFAPRNQGDTQCCDLKEEIAALTRGVLPNHLDFEMECFQIEDGKEGDYGDGGDSGKEDDDIENEEERVSALDALRRDEMENGESAIDKGTESNCVWSSDEEDNKEDAPKLEANAQSLFDEEEDLRKVPLPSYIGPLCDLLNSKDKPDEVESGLIAASSLIRNVPSDLEHYDTGLCRILLHLQNQYGITEFAAHKRRALVSLIVCRPRSILSMLPQQLFTKEWSVGVKLEILTVIVDAAREMSSLSTNSRQTLLVNQRNDGKGDDVSSISLQVDGAEKERWRVIDERVAAKTKRWASKPKCVPDKENKFAKYAVMVVTPLLIGYHENEPFLDEWPALHSRILFVMGCCVECSGRFGVDTLSISRDIAQLVFTLYCNHKLPEIRRTALFVLSRILLHISPMVLMEQQWFITELNGLVHHLVCMMEEDTDIGARDFSRLCLSQIKRAVEETQSIGFI